MLGQQKHNMELLKCRWPQTGQQGTELQVWEARSSEHGTRMSCLQLQGTECSGGDPHPSTGPSFSASESLTASLILPGAHPQRTILAYYPSGSPVGTVAYRVHIHLMEVGSKPESFVFAANQLQ